MPALILDAFAVGFLLLWLSLIPGAGFLILLAIVLMAPALLIALIQGLTYIETRFK